LKTPVLLLAFCVTLAASAQQTRPVAVTLTEADRFMQVSGTSVEYDKLESLLEKLAKKHSGLSDEEFVAFIFQKTHQVFLKRYSVSASFPQLFAEGTYNCLTGTILYSMVLHHFGITHDVIETNHHIFITAYVNGRTILMEATDPLNGLETESEEVQNRLEAYRRNIVTDSGTDQYHFSCNLYNRVTLDNLAGLLHYNLSIEAFNRHDLVRSVSHLSKSISFYCSPRTLEFAVLLSHAVQENVQLTTDQKIQLARSLRNIRARSQQTLAGLQP
jgi:hypothetical protein